MTSHEVHVGTDRGRDASCNTDIKSIAPEGRSCASKSKYRVLIGCLALGMLLAAPFAVAAPETYRFDPVHTQIWFSVDHLGFSHPLGRLRVAGGWFAFDADDWSTSRADVTLDMTSADMGDADWTDTVKSRQFLNVAEWPTAHFSGEHVEKTGARTGIIHGVLEFHGKRLPLDVAFTFNRSGNDPYTFRHKIGFSAKATLQRSAFGLNRYKEVVGDAVSLHFEIEGIRDRSAASRDDPSSHDTSEEMP